LIEVLFRETDPRTDDKLHFLEEMKYFNAGLNESQQEAIKKCLMSRDLSLIHGPPGTGKTTTVVELILQAVEH
jgi:superfamily II DNA or RNA helicase